MTTASKLISIARSQVGTREGRSSSGNWTNRVKYNDWYVKVTGREDFRFAAWCEIFVSWCADQAGIPQTVIPRSAYTPAGYAWYRSRGRTVKTPEAGDIVYFYYPSIRGIGHVGIVERRDGNYIYTIEGNTNTTGSSQGNGVYRLKRRITSYMRFVRPNYALLAKAPATPAKPVKASVDKGATVMKDPVKPKITNKVSVSHLKSARYSDPRKKGTPVGEYGNEVFTLETALEKTEWMKKGSVDGHYGTDTVGDGSAGFGGVKGFQKKHSGTSKPDGWLGKEELTLLFKLAGMKVTVAP